MQRGIDCGCRVVVLALSDQSARILLYHRIIVRRKILAHVLNSPALVQWAALFLVSKKTLLRSLFSFFAHQHPNCGISFFGNSHFHSVSTCFRKSDFLRLFREKFPRSPAASRHRSLRKFTMSSILWDVQTNQNGVRDRF